MKTVLVLACASFLSLAIPHQSHGTRPLRRDVSARNLGRLQQSSSMSCVLLGCGGSRLTPWRRLTSLAVRGGGNTYLFDAGEGTQIPYQEHQLGGRRLRLIAISHLHADHVLGLAGMLMFKAQSDEPTPLTILGPPHTRRHINHLRKDLKFCINYPINVVEWSEDAAPQPYRDERIEITWRPLSHSVPTLGYRLDEHLRAGTVDMDRIRELGVPIGPLIGALQRGEEVRLRGGAVVKPEDILGPSRPGRSIAYVTDSEPTENIEHLIRGVGVAFVESTFLTRHADDARKKMHLTATDAATIAASARPARLILTHFSPRYRNTDIADLEAEAQHVFSPTIAGSDGLRVDVPLVER